MKKVTAYYKRVVLITCPHCKKTLEIRNDDPIKVADTVSIGKVISCFSCTKLFKIASEEVL